MKLVSIDFLNNCIESIDTKSVISCFADLSKAFGNNIDADILIENLANLGANDLALNCF